MPRKPSVSKPSVANQAPAIKKASRRKSPSQPPIEEQPFVFPSEQSKYSNNTKSSSAIIVVLAVLVIVALGAYFSAAYFKNKAADDQALEDSISEEGLTDDSADATPTEPVDPTASWLPYSSAIATSSQSSTVSFKYPSELQVTRNADNIILSSDNASSTQVNIYWVKTAKPLKDYLAALDKLRAKDWEGKPSVLITTSTDAAVVSGQPAVFRQQKLLAADLNQYIAYVKHNDTVYAFSLAAPQLDQNLLSFFVNFLNNVKLGQ